MGRIFGQYTCKLDVKGRMKVPAEIKKQLEPSAGGCFMVNRGFDGNLSLYPFNEWEKIVAEVDKLNTFKGPERKFVRFFYNGATKLEMDAADRVNLPKMLLDHAGIGKELVLSAHSHVIEVWAKDRYEEVMGDDVDDIADIAGDVMGQVFG